MTSSRHIPADADLTYFTVTCHLAPIVADLSQDSDYDPNTARIDAVVTFTPKYKAGEVIHSHTSTPPTGFLALPVTAMIDDGYLKLRSKPDAGAAPLPGTLHGLKAKIAADTGKELPVTTDVRAALNYAPVRLLGNSASLEIEPEQPLYYDFTFTNIKIDGKQTNYVITGGTFEAPWEDTVIDLLDYMPLTPGPFAAPMVVGPQGPQGIPGPATVTAGSTTTSEPGSDALVSNVGDNVNAVFDFIIPRGETGPVGPAGPTSFNSFASVSAFPAVGDAQKVFLAEDTGDSFRWDGAKYVRVSERVLSTGITDSSVVGRALVTAATPLDEREVLLNPVASVEHYASLQTAFQQSRASALQFRGRASTYPLTSTVNVTGDSVLDLIGSAITQADNTNLDALVKINISLNTGIRHSDVKVFVDGNRDNNTTPVTGVVVDKIRKAFGRTTVGAINCDTAVSIPGDTEFAKFDIGVDSCGTALEIVTGTAARVSAEELPADQVDRDGESAVNAEGQLAITRESVVGRAVGVSSDELMIDLTAHNVETVVKTSGQIKTSGVIRVLAEQSSGWGMDLNVGWLELAGELRGCGDVANNTGCFRQGYQLKADGGAAGMLATRGKLILVGGSSLNTTDPEGKYCDWAVDLHYGGTVALDLFITGRYHGGVRVAKGVVAGSSAQLNISQPPESKEAILFYDPDNTGTISGFHVLPGSSIIAPGKVAINFDRASSCIVDATLIMGQIIFGANSGGNTVRIPRATANDVSFVNNRTANDNRVVFLGRYTLAQLDAMPVKFVGMFVEQVSDFAGASAHYDGQAWRTAQTRTRVTTVATSANPAFNVNNFDQLNVTGLTVNMASVGVTGTPFDGQQIRIRIKDNGTARTLAFGANFVGQLLTTTVAGKTHVQHCVYDSVAAKWVGVFADVNGY